MFLAWRTQLREAQRACELGRLEEAAQVLKQHRLQQYKPGVELATQLGTAFLQRALRRSEEQNFAGAAPDLAQARELLGQTELWLQAERRLAAAALAGIEQSLTQHDIADALRRLAALPAGVLPHDVILETQTAVRHIEAAQRLVRYGKYAEAQEQVGAALNLRPEWQSLVTRRQQLEQEQQHVREQSERLHRAMAASDWAQTLSVAENLLAVAPEYRLARDARQQAWRQVGAKVPDSQARSDNALWPQEIVKTAIQQMVAPKATTGTRFLLWVDSVGGYLVCQSNEIWLGQAAAGNAVAVPILGELSRRHAKLVRNGDRYVLEAAHDTAVDGKKVTGPCILKEGDEIELGRCVRLRFRQPHPLSATARLEMVSRHRTQPGCDGVLLMDQTCVLGGRWQDHVVCRDWPHEVVLFRQGEELYCKTAEPFEIDGVLTHVRGRLAPNSRVVGNEFSFSLELVK